MFVGVALLVVAASCLGPTEVMVTISTNACGNLTRTDVYVGSGLATSTGGCTDGQTVGTIALVPSSGIDQRLDITIVGAVGGTCDGADTQEASCIVARRSLSFIPHKRLDLPIFLDTRCANTPCGPTETCVADPTPHCESKECDVDGGVVCSSDAGGPPPEDVQTIDVTPEAPIDAPSTCPVVALGTPTYVWSFDVATDAVHEDVDAVKPELFTNGTIGTDPLFCGNFLASPKGSQTIASGATKLATKTFTIGFAYQATADGTLVRLDSFQLNTGFSIQISQGALVVVFEKLSPYEVYRDGGNTADGKWHIALVEIVSSLNDAGAPTSSTVRVTLDGVVSKVAGTPIPYPLSASSMAVGPIDAIDQITYYAF